MLIFDSQTEQAFAGFTVGTCVACRRLAVMGLVSQATSLTLSSVPMPWTGDETQALCGSCAEWQPFEDCPYPIVGTEHQAVAMLRRVALQETTSPHAAPPDPLAPPPPPWAVAAATLKAPSLPPPPPGPPSAEPPASWAAPGWRPAPDAPWVAAASPLSAEAPSWTWDAPPDGDADHGRWLVARARHGFAAGDIVRLERFGPTLFVSSDLWSVDLVAQGLVASVDAGALILRSGTTRLRLAPVDGQDPGRIAAAPW